LNAVRILRQCLFFVSIPLFFVNFSMPVQSKALGANAVEIGGLFSLFTFSILLMRPVIGAGIDRFGRRAFFLAGMVFYAFAYMGYAFSQGIETMYFARFLQGLAASLLLITVDTMTADWVDDDARGKAMGANVEIQTRASIVGATIGFSLVASMPLLAWKLSFGAFALIAVLAFFYALIRLPESKPVQLSAVRSKLYLTASLKRLLVLLFFLGLSNALILPIYLIYLQDNFTADVRMLSWAFLPAAFVFMVLPSRLGDLTDKRGPVNLMVLGLGFTGVLYLIMPSAGAFWPFVLIYTVSSIGWALVEPTRKAMVAAQSTSSTRARTFAVAEMAYGFGATIGPLLGGLLYDSVGQDSPYYVNGLLLLVIAFVARILLRRYKTEQQAGDML